MAEKTVPWWRKALNFALGGIRTGFGLLARLAKPEAAAEPGIAEGPAENPEEEASLIEDFPNSETAATETIATVVPAVDAEAASVSETALAAEPAIESPEPVHLEAPAANVPDRDVSGPQESASDSGGLPAPEEAVPLEIQDANGYLEAATEAPVVESAFPDIEEQPEQPELQVSEPIAVAEAAPVPEHAAEPVPEEQPEEVLAEQTVLPEESTAAATPDAGVAPLPEALPEPAMAVEADLHELVPLPVLEEPAEDLSAEEPVVTVEVLPITPDIGSEPAPEAAFSELPAETAPLEQPDEELEAEANRIVETQTESEPGPVTESVPAAKAAEDALIVSTDADKPIVGVEDRADFAGVAYGRRQAAFTVAASSTPVDPVPAAETCIDPGDRTEETSEPLDTVVPPLSTLPQAEAVSEAETEVEAEAPVEPQAESEPAPAPEAVAVSEVAPDEMGLSRAAEEQVSEAEVDVESAGATHGAASLPAASIAVLAAAPVADLAMETEAAVEPLGTMEPPLGQALPTGTVLEPEAIAVPAQESPVEAEAPAEPLTVVEPSADSGAITAEAGSEAEPTAESAMDTEMAVELPLSENLPAEAACDVEPLPVSEGASAHEALSEPEAGAAVDAEEQASETALATEPLPASEIVPQLEPETAVAAEERTELAPETEPETAAGAGPAMIPAAETGADTASEAAPVAAAAPEPVQPVEAAPPAAVHAKPQIVIKSRDNEADLSPFSVIVDQVYDGPLDLLLDLIRKQDIDIYDIPIAKITAQFLAYVNQLKAGDVDVAGEFIYIASLLIHIKSKMLLPRAPAGPDDAAEDPRRELVERLLEHERFKNAAQMLQQKQMLEAATWTNPGVREFKGDAAAEPEIAADTVDLVRIFRDILERARKRPVFNVDDDQVTVGQMIQYLSRRLNMEDKPIALRRLLSHTRSERSLIAMFLAMLELVRLQAILLRQDRAFSEIFIKKHTGFDAVMNQGLANPQDDWR
jgi:segregation and condensation protein A